MSSPDPNADTATIDGATDAHDLARSRTSGNERTTERRPGGGDREYDGDHGCDDHPKVSTRDAPLIAFVDCRKGSDRTGKVGDPSSPFLTIPAAVRRIESKAGAAPGGVVSIAPGVYRGDVGVSGPVHVLGSRREPPILLGTIRVHGGPFASRDVHRVRGQGAHAHGKPRHPRPLDRDGDGDGDGADGGSGHNGSCMDARAEAITRKRNRCRARRKGDGRSEDRGHPFTVIVEGMALASPDHEALVAEGCRVVLRDCVLLSSSCDSDGDSGDEGEGECTGEGHDDVGEGCGANESAGEEARHNSGKGDTAEPRSGSRGEPKASFAAVADAALWGSEPFPPSSLRPSGWGACVRARQSSVSIERTTCIREGEGNRPETAVCAEMGSAIEATDCRFEASTSLRALGACGPSGTGGIGAGDAVAVACVEGSTWSLARCRVTSLVGAASAVAPGCPIGENADVRTRAWSVGFGVDSEAEAPGEGREAGHVTCEVGSGGPEGPPCRDVGVHVRHPSIPITVVECEVETVNRVNRDMTALVMRLDGRSDAPLQGALVRRVGAPDGFVGASLRGPSGRGWGGGRDGITSGGTGVNGSDGGRVGMRSNAMRSDEVPPRSAVRTVGASPAAGDELASSGTVKTVFVVPGDTVDLSLHRSGTRFHVAFTPETQARAAGGSVRADGCAACDLDEGRGKDKEGRKGKDGASARGSDRRERGRGGLGGDDDDDAPTFVLPEGETGQWYEFFRGEIADADFGVMFRNPRCAMLRGCVLRVDVPGVPFVQTVYTDAPRIFGLLSVGMSSLRLVCTTRGVWDIGGMAFASAHVA